MATRYRPSLNYDSTRDTEKMTTVTIERIGDPNDKGHARVYFEGGNAFVFANDLPKVKVGMEVQIEEVPGKEGGKNWMKVFFPKPAGNRGGGGGGGRKVDEESIAAQVIVKESTAIYNSEMVRVNGKEFDRKRYLEIVGAVTTGYQAAYLALGGGSN